MFKSSSKERFPELYAGKVKKVVNGGRVRTVPMRVLALGMPRTGTASLWTALKLLGYEDTHHMMSVLGNPDDAVMWARAADAKQAGLPFGRTEWDQLLGDYQAVCDFPGAAFAEDLIAAYPEAQVVLNGRNIDAWYDSCMSTIQAVRSSRLGSILAWTDSYFYGKFQIMVIKLFNLAWADDFPRLGKLGYVTHYERVRRLVPRERLLEFNVADGWEPLCTFLGQPVPSTPFPNVNDKQAFGERVKRMHKMALFRSIPRLITVLMCLVATFYVAYHLLLVR